MYGPTCTYTNVCALLPLVRKTLPTRHWFTTLRWCMSWSRGTRIGHRQSCGLWLMNLIAHMKLPCHTSSKLVYTTVCLYLDPDTFTWITMFQGSCKLHSKFRSYQTHHVCRQYALWPGPVCKWENMEILSEIGGGVTCWKTDWHFVQIFCNMPVDCMYCQFLTLTHLAKEFIVTACCGERCLD